MLTASLPPSGGPPEQVDNSRCIAGLSEVYTLAYFAITPAYFAITLAYLAIPSLSDVSDVVTLVTLKF